MTCNGTRRILCKVNPLVTDFKLRIQSVEAKKRKNLKKIFKISFVNQSSVNQPHTIHQVFV